MAALEAAPKRMPASAGATTRASMQQQTDPDDEILTPEQVAEWLHVKVRWVHAHANHNRRPHLPGFKAGKFWRFRRGDVRDALKKWQHTAAK